MSKQLRAFRDGQDRRIIQPYVRDGGAWNEAARIYRKEGGVWVEWWPLLPLPPVNLAASFTYRNDRIELDVDWDAPVGGAAIDYYEVQFQTQDAQWSYTTSGTVLTPDRGWEEFAGRQGAVRVRGANVNGPGEWASVGPIFVPQLPPPPNPTNVLFGLANRRGTLTWDHVGGNRLASFEIRTSFASLVRDTAAPKAARSSDVTFWDSSNTPGTPGGDVGVLIRAVGQGGYSAWVGTGGAVPSVPKPPPPPAAKIPATPVVTNHRFLNGTLSCAYTCADATTVKIWWQEEGGSLIALVDQGPTGTVSVAATTALPRTGIFKYRIAIQGVNASGGTGQIAYGPWSIKMPNPFYLVPNNFVSYRGYFPDTFLPNALRQGSSFNELNYRNPIIVWRGFLMYPKNPLDESVIGYTPNVTAAAVLIQRSTIGGSGQAVSPHVWWHAYTTKENVGASVFSGAYLPGLRRGESRWLAIDRVLTQRLIDLQDTGVTGLSTYDDDQVLLDFLGEVSRNYMIIDGPFAQIGSFTAWTIRIDHDG